MPPNDDTKYCLSLVSISTGWIPGSFKNFSFEPKFSFLRENDKNDNSGEFQDFPNSPYIWLCIFFGKLPLSEIPIRYGQFLKIRKIDMKFEFVRIREFTLVIILMIFFLNNDKLCWKMKIITRLNYWVFTNSRYIWFSRFSRKRQFS